MFELEIFLCVDILLLFAQYTFMCVCVCICVLVSVCVNGVGFHVCSSLNERGNAPASFIYLSVGEVIAGQRGGG